MILEKIKNFDWFNEPLNVGFNDNGVIITTRPYTDFWQNTDCNISKNDGHLFATEENSDNFVITVKWSFPQIKASAQCGIMIFSDEKNWIKMGVLTSNPFNPQIGCVVANDGSSDWSSSKINQDIHCLWFKIVRRKNDFSLSFSCDGEKFNQVRLLHHPKIAKTTKTGAYACSPQEDVFCCVLEDIDIKKPL